MNLKRFGTPTPQLNQRGVFVDTRQNWGTVARFWIDKPPYRDLSAMTNTRQQTMTLTTHTDNTNYKHRQHDNRQETMTHTTYNDYDTTNITAHPPVARPLSRQTKG